MIDRDIRIELTLQDTALQDRSCIPDTEDVVGMNGKKSGHDRKTDRQIQLNADRR